MYTTPAILPAVHAVSSGYGCAGGKRRPKGLGSSRTLITRLSLNLAIEALRASLTGLAGPFPAKPADTH